MNEQTKKYTCNSNAPLADALRVINENAKGIVYLIDTEERLVGSLSDGDVRRWILKHGNIEGVAGDAAHKDVKYIKQDDFDSAQLFMENENVDSMPLVDDDLRVIDILFQSNRRASGAKRANALRNTPIIIMAGGKGARLYPFTKILPKPLIPVGDIPILERILNRFYQNGAQEFYVSVNYKKEIIKSYFQEQNPPYVIHYVEEETPRGTAGSIRLIQKSFERPVLITNCDILIDVDYGKLLSFHRDSNNDVTIVSALKNTYIPYGVLHTEEHGIISAMEEKPQISNFINTGMYIVNPEFLGRIPDQGIYHMTDLITLLLNEKRKIAMYPISENSFLDMGEFEELRKMESRIKDD